MFVRKADYIRPDRWFIYTAPHTPYHHKGAKVQFASEADALAFIASLTETTK